MNKQETSIQLKLQRSETALEEADIMIQNEYYNAAVNRLYYSCFYATLGLLLTKNVTPKTHNGTATQLQQHFTQNGNFDKRLSGFYTSLMQQRKDSDYSDFLVMTKAEIEELRTNAKEYIDHIISLISLT